MRPLSTSALRATALLSLPAAILGATNFDCSDIVQDGIRFNLKELGGPFVVNNVIDDGISKTNQTFTIDICRPLKKLSDLKSQFQCPSGTSVCLQDYVTRAGDDKPAVEKVVPIAGNFIHEGRGWNPTWQRLSQSDSHADAGREGLRIVFDGGKYPFEDKKNFTSQKAVVELVCDPHRTGLEGDEQDKRPTDDERRKRDDTEKDDGEDAKEPTGPSLNFVSYENVGEGKDAVGTLRLEWRTKHACERDDGGSSGGSGSKESGWGFFTWFLIILFLAISAYLIFGSWLNYNRYGARGWDLLPHGDTIRDIPYLMKDWGRKVVNTVQGGGSRGGYSAV